MRLKKKDKLTAYWDKKENCIGANHNIIKSYKSYVVNTAMYNLVKQNNGGKVIWKQDNY